ncbi:MAG TPA: secernin-3, partial [Oscillospiraceae bacterium]|nr:secernin-3 [Oscillospiraceae bacterium]
SDRSPNEPQLIELIPPKTHGEKTLKVTYIEVEQVKETYGLLLSRPSWMWGGEMGLNDCGVAIGNEAVFTKGKYGKEALLGMDLLRLALERAETAKNALDIIINLLERYGQGGNCGYDKRFEYDNAFLIMDKDDIF